jgi:hypothetical protein
MDLAREVSFPGTPADEGATIFADLSLGKAIRNALHRTDVP